MSDKNEIAAKFNPSFFTFALNKDKNEGEE